MVRVWASVCRATLAGGILAWTSAASAQAPPTAPTRPKGPPSAGSESAPARPPARPPTPPAQGGERLSDEAELDRVASLYSGGRYDECKQRLASLLDPNNPERLQQPSIVETARMYHATCLLMLGETEAAAEPVREALRANPTMGIPDRLTFPPPLVSLFLRVRDEFHEVIKKQEQERLARLQKEAELIKQREEKEAKRLQRLERLAGQRTIVEENRRWIATIPFGVGQFQNGSDALGYGFLITEAALAGTTLASWFIMSYQYELLRDASNSRKDIVRNARIAYNVQLATSYGFLAVALGGVVEAHVNFVDSKQRIETRPLPEELRSKKRPSAQLTPWLMPTRGGASLGLSGSF